MKKWFAALLTLMLVLALAVPAMAEDTVALKIATWTSNESQLELLGSFVEEFAQLKGIGIDVTFESIDYNEYNTKLLLELQGSDAPDLYWVLETSAPAFIASGNLAKLNDALAAYDPDDISEGAFALWKDGEDVYAVPFSTSPFILIYNVDLFRQAGVKTPDELIAEDSWTWETFREISKQIKDATGVWGYQTVDGDGYNTRVLHNLLPIIRAFGGDAWDEDGNVLIDSEESVAAVQLFHDMVYVDGSVVPPGDESSFYTGAAAMTVGQISRLSNLDEVTWEWGICTLPGNSPVIGQAALGAFSGSKNVEIAAELAAYMTSESCAARIAGIWPPTRKAVLDSDDFLTSNSRIAPEQMKSAVAASIETGRVLPAHVLYPQIEVEAKIAYDKLWNANADVAAIMKDVADVYRSYLN
ncbi:MAG: sugar ABC transporter substrate-binding protein [Clostridia bacterium]|nr:sugar ABC transporter substrate-binding protein [Clostridia bacterium]